MNTLEAIRGRRSIRVYTKQRIPSAMVHDLLEAAMCAPSARNEQPWCFIVVDDPETLRRISTIHPFAHMAAHAPLAILVCGDTRHLKDAGYWPQDCGAAVQNLLLAAHEHGLGAVWTGVYPVEDRVKAFTALFQLPDGVIPQALIPVGFPEEVRPPQQRYDESRIHKNAW